MKFCEIDCAKTIRDFPEEGIEKGETGTIVMAYTDPYEAYEVEFVNDDGTTKGIFTILPENIEKI